MSALTIKDLKNLIADIPDDTKVTVALENGFEFEVYKAQYYNEVNGIFWSCDKVFTIYI